MNYPDFYGSLSPYQQGLVDKMMANDYRYTFGPGSPGATYEDKNTYVGGRYSPAGGFAVNGGWALAPKDYYSFTRDQQRALNIMDIGPRGHQGLLERYFSGGVKGVKNLYSGGMNSARNLFGGRPSGPWQGWNRQDVEQWRNGPGYEPVQDPSTGNPYFGMNPGNTQGGPTILNTNWSQTPWGNVPMAPLANPQASNVLSNYFNPPGQGAGTGVPTQRVGGAIVGGISNAFIPGLGLLTGPLTKMLIRQMQRGGQPGQPGAPATPKPGGGQGNPRGDPFGLGSSYPPGYLAKWFGKGQGGEFGRPGDSSEPASFGNNSSPFGSNTTSFVGGGGNPNLPTGGSYFGGAGSLSLPGGGNLGNLGGSGGTVSGGADNAIANGILRRLYKFGTPTTIGNNAGPNYQFGNNVMGGQVSSPGWAFGRNILLNRGITSVGGGNMGNNTGRGLKGES